MGKWRVGEERWELFSLSMSSLFLPLHLHFLILSPFSLSISSFSLHFLILSIFSPLFHYLTIFSKLHFYNSDFDVFCPLFLILGPILPFLQTIPPYCAHLGKVSFNHLMTIAIPRYFVFVLYCVCIEHVSNLTFQNCISPKFERIPSI